MYQHCAKWAFNQKVRPRVFEEGDLVLKKRNQALPAHRGKFAPTYKGPYVVKKAFSGGALILANMDGHDFNMPTNSDAVIWYSAWKSLAVHLIFMSKKREKKTKKKKKKNTKRWIENPKGRSMQKESQKK